MSRSSSTSSFSYNQLESVTPSRIPRAALVVVLGIVVVELVLRQSLVWYADEAAWFWKSKAELIEQGSLDGQIALLGSSVSFHGIDPVISNAQTPQVRAVNLALNGMLLQHETQLLERYLQRGNSPHIIVLELRQVLIEPESWIRGPYWQFWASPGEFLQSGAQYAEPELWMPFLANRVLISFSFRAGLDNWISESARQRQISHGVRDRNLRIAEGLATHQGFDPGSAFATSLKAEPETPGEPRPWVVEPPGEYWLARLFAICQERGIQVVLFQPPVPPWVARERSQGNFDDDFASYVAQQQQKHPQLGLTVFAPSGYELSDFADNHHLSHQGSRRLSQDFADWVSSLDDRGLLK